MVDYSMRITAIQISNNVDDKHINSFINFQKTPVLCDKKDKKSSRTDKVIFGSLATFTIILIIFMLKKIFRRPSSR